MLFNIIRTFIFCIFISFIMVTQAVALEMEYGRFNLYDEEQDDCINEICTIYFDKSYDTVPLVFLMDTVSYNDEYDSPSTLKILEITTTYVKFKQQIAPDNKGDSYTYSPLVDQPMSEVDYLVAEEGVHEFDDDVYIIAGSVSTSYFQGNKYSNNFKNNRSDYGQWNTVSFSDYRDNFSFSSTPGVLHQVQSTHNGEEFWITSTVKSVGTSSFKISLERSEVDAWQSTWTDIEYPQQAETIGFLAAYGEGYTDDVKFSIGSQQSSSSLSNTMPVTYGCESYTYYGPYSSRPIIVANKNTRSGGNGGWLRRCRLQTDSASFMIDEDLDSDTERRHTGETVGYFLFELPLEFNTQCELFKGPVQTWKPETDSNGDTDEDGTFRINSSDVFNTSDHQIGFLDSEITNQNLNNNHGCFLGSDNTTQVGDCEGYTGSNSDLRLSSKPNFNEINIGSEDVSVGNNESLTLTDGQYDEVSVTNGELTLKAGEYWIRSLKMNNGGVIKLSGSVAIYANSISLVNSEINTDGDATDLLITVSSNYISSTSTSDTATSNYGEVSLTNQSEIRGLVVSEGSVTLNSSVIYGAVTAQEVILKNQSQIYESINDCDDADEQYLNISPATETATLGDNILITFQVVDEDNNLQSVNDNLIITSDQGDFCWSTSPMTECSNSSDSVSEIVPISGGELELYLYSNTEQNISITAYLGSEQSQTYSSGGPYIFELNGGFIFEPSPAYITAGKSETITITAVESDDTSSVVTQYDGEVTLTLSDTNYLIPSSGTQSVTFSDGSSEQTVSFTEGVASIDLIYQDAGAVLVTFEDQVNELSGSLTLKSIPYAFAMCAASASESGNTDYSGTAASGDDFAKAGENFSLTLKPVAWSSSAENEKVDGILQADQLCGETVTTNFYTVGSQEAFVAVESGSGFTPSGGQLGDFAVDGDREFSSATDTSGKQVGAMTYSEAGSIDIEFSGEGNGNMFFSSDETLDADIPVIETSEVHIGRFYPDYFTLVSSSVINAMTGGDSSFTYMGQEFQVSFAAEARNRDDDITYNYDADLLSYDALEAVKLTASSGETDLTDRLDQSSMTTGWESNWVNGSLSVTDDALIFERVEETDSPLTTTPDGPYSASLYLQADHSDCDYCTEFDGDDDQAELSGELDARYGRIRLSDVGGVADSVINVPLKVQYWDGSGFITNTDDNETTFNGAAYCSLAIWPDSGSASAARLQQSGTVSLGTGTNLTADRNPSSEEREQVRLWLRIQSDQPLGTDTCSGGTVTDTEWLMYDWRDLGDEDPSAVITFGVYRGNDRVIYRGESRLINTTN